jgi:hypothetical protein
LNFTPDTVSLIPLEVAEAELVIEAAAGVVVEGEACDPELIEAEKADEQDIEDEEHRVPHDDFEMEDEVDGREDVIRYNHYTDIKRMCAGNLQENRGRPELQRPSGFVCPICRIDIVNLPKIHLTTCAHVICAFCLIGMVRARDSVVGELPCPKCRDPFDLINAGRILLDSII